MTHAPWYRRGILRRIGQQRDEGVALVVVVGTMMVLAMLVTVSMAYTMAGQKFARYDQDYSAAMSAAQSGIDDFISRLNRNDDYGQTVDCANRAWQGPMDPTTYPWQANTCGWTTTTAAGWLPVTPGDTDPRGAAFHYSVDGSQKGATGTVMLDVTGRVNGVYRSVETAVGKSGSTDYVYYTDFESADPSNIQAYPSGAPNDACGKSGFTTAEHWYQGRSSAGCQEITFISNDTLDGAVFTNDTILSDGASFLKGVETATPNCANATDKQSTWNSSCLRSGSTADFNGIKPLYANPLYLDDNTADFATDPGCHYYGSTRVVFKEDGTMTVWSKNANGAAPLAKAAPGGTAPNCGDATTLASENGQTLPVPNNMVIYADSASGASKQCYADGIGGPAGATLPLGTYGASSVNPPTASGQSYTYDANMAETLKTCNQGNLYAEGVLKGRVTIASAQSVVVTGDLVLAGGINGTDMLGLVATNSVEVFHPRMVTVSATQASKTCNKSNQCTYTYQWGSPANEQEASSSPYNAGTWPKRYKASTESGYTPTTGIQIAGSIQTLQHSFLVQKYSSGGNKGTLLVNGSIAQRWRGIVGQSSGGTQNGYTKLYKYDTRLVYTKPPYFPPWVNSKWTLRYSGEIKTPSGVAG